MFLLVAALHASLVLQSTRIPGTGEPDRTPPSRVKFEPVTRRVESATAVTGHPDDPTRIYVVEQAGRVRVVRDGVLLPTPFLDIDPDVTDFPFFEGGMLDLEFHPDHTRNGAVYFSYSSGDYDGAVSLVVERIEVVPGNPDLADPSTRRVVLRQDGFFFAQHVAGGLAFGPDRKLYVGVGDRVSPCEAQDLGTVFGSVLRLEDDGSTPVDNPFVGRPGVDERVWLHGVRNPWRFDFDPETGDLFLGDVGNQQVEEIDRLPFRRAAGANLGWPWLEGDQCFRACSGGGSCTDPSYVPPLHTYDHGTGCAVLGGIVYRGCALPRLSGTYFFADYCSGQLWSLGTRRGADPRPRDWSRLLPWGGSQVPRQITSFGRDAFGELYVADQIGGVWKLVPDPSVDRNDDGVEDGCQATASVRTGSNPVLFLETARAALGGSWETTVDLQTTGGLASLVVVSKVGALSPGISGGFPLQGELLIQLPLGMQHMGMGSHAVPVPFVTGLLGASFSAQAAAVTPSRIVLTNALDVVVGL